MRVLALIGAFAEGEAEAWVETLAAIVARSHLVDDADAIEALESITQAAADPALSYAVRQRLYTAATERGHASIARLFLSASPPTANESQLKKQLAPERPLKPTGRPLTLGARRWRARTSARTCSSSFAIRTRRSSRSSSEIRMSPRRRSSRSRRFGPRSPKR